MALSIRLVSTCSSRSGSPVTAGTGAGLRGRAIFTYTSVARTSNTAPTWFTSSARSTSSIIISVEREVFRQKIQDQMSKRNAASEIE